jgi:hypothetical protein
MNTDCPVSAIIYNLTNKVRDIGNSVKKTTRYRLFHEGNGKELTTSERDLARAMYCTDELVTKNERQTWWRQHGRDKKPPFVEKDRVTLKPADAKRDIVRGHVFSQTFINALLVELSKSRFPKKSLIGLEHFLKVTIAAPGNPGNQELIIISEVKKILREDSKIRKAISATRVRENRTLALQTKTMATMVDEWKFEGIPTKWFVRDFCKKSGLSKYHTQAIVQHVSTLHTRTIGEIIVSKLPALSKFLNDVPLVCDSVSNYKEQGRSNKRNPRLARRRKKTARSNTRGTLLPSEMEIEDFEYVALVSELDTHTPLSARGFMIGDLSPYHRKPLGQHGGKHPLLIDREGYKAIAYMAMGKAAVSLADEKMSTDELMCVTRNGIVDHFLNDEFTQDRSTTVYVKSRTYINKQVFEHKRSLLEEEEPLNSVNEAAEVYKAELIAANEAAASTDDDDDLKAKGIFDRRNSYLRKLVERAHGYQLKFQDTGNETLEDNKIDSPEGPSLTTDERNFLLRVGMLTTQHHSCHNTEKQWTSINELTQSYVNWDNTPLDERKDFVGVCFDLNQFTVSAKTMNEYMRLFYRYACAIVPQVLDFGVDMDNTMVTLGKVWCKRTVPVRVMLQERADRQLKELLSLKEKYKNKRAEESAKKSNKKKAHVRLNKNRTRARRKNQRDENGV